MDIEFSLRNILQDFHSNYKVHSIGCLGYNPNFLFGTQLNIALMHKWWVLLHTTWLEKIMDIKVWFVYKKKKHKSRSDRPAKSKYLTRRSFPSIHVIYRCLHDLLPTSRIKGPLFTRKEKIKKTLSKSRRQTNRCLK